MSVVEGPRVPDNALVICPNCVHQFRAIPVDVQQQMAMQLKDLEKSELALEAAQENVREILRTRAYPLLPLGCRTRLWHAWGRWEEHAAGESRITHLPTATDKATGQLIIQQRACKACGTVQLRTAYS